MKIVCITNLLFFAFVAEVAHASAVWVTRNVRQVSFATCEPNRGSTVRAFRYPNLDEGRYLFSAVLDQEVTIAGNCASTTSSVTSSLLLDDKTLIAEHTFTSSGTCSTKKNGGEPVQGFFQVTKAGDVKLTFVTTGGDCAGVLGLWENIEIIQCPGKDASGIKNEIKQAKSKIRKAKKKGAEAYSLAKTIVGNLKNELKMAKKCGI